MSLALVVAACGRDVETLASGADAALLDSALPLIDASLAETGDGALTARMDASVPNVPAPGAPALCARAGDDAVRDLFCVSTQPAVFGLRTLQELLGLNVIPPEFDEAAAANVQIEPTAITDMMVVLGHSTALAGQLVSPLNPRVILIAPDVMMAFQRGVQQVELAGFDRLTNQVNLYLLTFRQACNALPAGCGPGDLFTPALERDWSSVALSDAEDLKNTPADCRQCHQRNMPSPLLLMRELRAPWTHFFALDELAPDYQSDAGVTGRELALDFQAAKGSEIYAGVPAAVFSHTVGVTLQNRVSSSQPLEFDAPSIDDELNPRDAGSGSPRRSATWDAAYAAFKRGEQLALPHFETRPTDPAKLAALTAAYLQFRQGALTRAALPDLADIYPDDPQVRAEIGLQTEPGATPAETLIQACGACHNDVLDQSISRALFNIALSRMSRTELDLAITRIERAEMAEDVMPPHDSRQLDADARSRLLDYLRLNQRSPADDALLEHAAQVGMANDPWSGMRY